MLTVGSLLTNCYIVWSNETKEAIVIDPGFDRQGEARKVLNVLKENKLKVKFIVDTHGHPDHTCGNGFVKGATASLILIHELDANMLSKSGKRLAALFGFRVASSVADGYLKDGEVVEFGEIVLRILHTPGHSPGSISLIGKDYIFTGDTLFAGSIGRVDLPGGSGEEIQDSLRKLAALPERLVVYPGHGSESTIREEKHSNPFLQRAHLDDSFLW